MKTAINPTIQAALALDNLSIQFKIEFSAADAVVFARHASPHGHTQAALEKLIQKINGFAPVMDFGGSNPNNGRHFHTFEIGKEYSRVVYVRMVKTYLNHGVNKNKTGIVDRFIADVSRLAKAAGAEEIGVEENTDSFLKIRLWWD